MKIILSESQYNRLFNNKKRKLIITENQYKKLLFEANLHSQFSKIKLYDIIKLNQKQQNGQSISLHFRVKDIDPSKGLIMVNCNNGIYKNAYFHITKDGYDTKSKELKYRSAQEKKITDKIGENGSPWETIDDTSVWRQSTFKNITRISIYDDGGKEDCNLSNTAEKRFIIGSVEDVEFSDKEIKDLMNDDENIKNLIQTKPGQWLEFLGLARKKGVIPSIEIFNKWGANPNNLGSLSNFKKDKNIKVQFIGDVTDKGTDTPKLTEIVNGIKNIGNKATLKVSRNYNGEQYLKLNGKIDNIFYTLRVPSNSSNEKDIYKVEIVSKSSNVNKGDVILGEVKIKILDYDTEKI